MRPFLQQQLVTAIGRMANTTTPACSNCFSERIRLVGNSQFMLALKKLYVSSLSPPLQSPWHISILFRGLHSLSSLSLSLPMWHIFATRPLKSLHHYQSLSSLLPLSSPRPRQPAPLSFSLSYAHAPRAALVFPCSLIRGNKTEQHSSCLSLKVRYVSTFHIREDQIEQLKVGLQTFDTSKCILKSTFFFGYFHSAPFAFVRSCILCLVEIHRLLSNKSLFTSRLAYPLIFYACILVILIHNDVCLL